MLQLDGLPATGYRNAYPITSESFVWQIVAHFGGPWRQG